MVTLINKHGAYTVQINGFVVATEVSLAEAKRIIHDYDFT